MSMKAAPGGYLGRGQKDVRRIGEEWKGRAGVGYDPVRGSVFKVARIDFKKNAFQ